MQKISISESIKAGNWYNINTVDYNDNLICTRFTVIGFEPINSNFAAVNYYDMFPNYSACDGRFMLLKLVIVNTSKNPVYSAHVRDQFCLIDDEGYSYGCYPSHGHISCSQWACENGVANFLVPHNPKIKYHGSIIFLLPNDCSNDLAIVFNTSTQVI